MSVVDKIQLQRGGPFYDIRDNSKSPLDHTHDDRYYTESEVDTRIASINLCNRNLLDNPWFTVNQRGSSEYRNALYTVDRWYKDYANPVVSVNTSEITLQFVSGSEQNFSQRIEFDVIEQCFGKSVTLSVLLNSGEVKSATFNMPNNYPDASTEVGKAILEDGLIAELRMYQKSFRNPIIRIINRDQQAHEVTVRAIKFEIGSASTLVNEQPPDYTTELLKCHRYFVRIKSNATGMFGVGIAPANNYAYIVIPIPVPLRAIPAISITGLSNFRLYNGYSIAVLDITYHDLLTASVSVQVSGTNLTANSSYGVYANAQSYIDLSADL